VHSVAAPLLPNTDGPVTCQNNCKLKSGEPTQGSQACIEHKCCKCCVNAAEDAKEKNIPCDPCKSHSVSAVSDVHSVPATIPTAPSPLPADGVATPLQPVIIPPNPTPTTQSQAHSQSQHDNRHRPLAQPLGPNWLHNKNVADHDKAQMEALKVQHLWMDENEKGTCEFVIYYEASIRTSVFSLLST
jgi:hypothetical protein